jgi:hypothetical protein
MFLLSLSQLSQTVENRAFLILKFLFFPSCHSDNCFRVRQLTLVCIVMIDVQVTDIWHTHLSKLVALRLEGGSKATPIIGNSSDNATTDENDLGLYNCHSDAK